MMLHIDLGFDEISEDLFQVIVFDKSTMETFCHVFGKTIEECSKRANALVYAMNTPNVLEELNDLRKEYLKDELEKYKDI